MLRWIVIVINDRVVVKNDTGSPLFSVVVTAHWSLVHAVHFVDTYKNRSASVFNIKLPVVLILIEGT